MAICLFRMTARTSN